MFHFPQDCLKSFPQRPTAGLPALVRGTICLITCLLIDGGLLCGQDEKAGDEKPKIPPAKKEVLITKDGVSLHCQFYPGTRKKETIPVILIHGWEGRGSQYSKLASYLQAKGGHAVLVPDLRGHGLSTRRRGNKPTIRYDRMSKQEWMMMGNDLDACKSFLKKQNNEGLLNLNQLCLVGSEFGAMLALNWAVVDWNYRDLPTIKQGRDVHGLVLLSPSKSVKGLGIQAALKHQGVRALSTMIITGTQSSSLYKDARQIHKSLEKFHPKPPLDKKQLLLKKDLFLVERDTDRQGVDLLAEDVKPSIIPTIGGFILYRLDKQKSKYPWSDRSNPFKESE